MAIWDVEIVKADGNMYAFIRVQNDFTGNISGSFRRIYKDKNGFYAKVDGANHYFNNEVARFTAYQEQIRDALEFRKKVR